MLKKLLRNRKNNKLKNNNKYNKNRKKYMLKKEVK